MLRGVAWRGVTWLGHKVQDVVSFDKFVSAQTDNSQDFLTSFDAAYACPNYSGHRIRFDQSAICFFAVANSNTVCLTPTQPTPSASTPTAGAITGASSNITVSQNTPSSLVLCKSTCKAYIDSLTAIFTNASLCDQSPAAAAAANRVAAIGLAGPRLSYADYCATLTTDDRSICSLGIKTDVANCGFASLMDGIAYCASNKNETCCSAMPSSSAPSSAYDFLAPPNRVWVISTIVAVALVALCVIYFAVTKIAHWVDKSTTPSYQPKEDLESPAPNFESQATLRQPRDLESLGIKLRNSTIVAAAPPQTTLDINTDPNKRGSLLAMLYQKGASPGTPTSAGGGPTQNRVAPTVPKPSSPALADPSRAD
eukprot:jgi/Hompol1/3356/HPOL_006486-RA